MKIKSIGVRELVEFSLKSGDLKSSGAGRQNTALDGSRIHRMIQASWNDDVSVETDLQMQITAGKTPLLIHGRADGLHQTGGIVDEVLEIKTSSFNFSELPNNILTLYFAQAKIYSHILMKESNLAQMKVTLLYFQTTTEQLSKKTVVVTRKEASEIFNRAVSEYQKWLELENVLREQRQESLKMLKFPFDKYRKNQRELAVCVYKTIASKKRLFVEAPTGTGKTVSVLFPALKAMGEEKCSRIFYLTAKQSTRKSCEDAIALMKPNLRSITLTAKDKITFDEEKDLPDDQNPYFIGYYDRIRPAMQDVLKHETMITRDVIERYARLHQVDPFEFSLDLSLFCDVIICDYNYLFDPLVYLQRFFTDEHPDCCFLIDEAHNLVDRGREMYSAHVDRADVLEAKKLAADYSKGLVRALEKVNRQLRTLEKECTEYEILPNPGAVSLGMLQVMGEMDKLLEELHGKELPEQLLEFYFCVRDFLNIDELLDENYVVYTEMGEGGKVILRLFCVNPAANIHRCLEKGKSAVFFSATLLPMDYYRALLSTRKDDYGIYVTSPFRQENRCILTGRDVSSRYTRRGYEEYHRIASYIARTVWTRKGNYMVFFPSYKFMEDVLEVYENEFSAEWVRCISQTSGMNEREKEEFLEEFSASEGTLVGFCVMGGIFSEGIDLMGEKLIGAIIIGTGLPQIGTEREILRQYYDKKGVNGFDYAYRYPGMNKVLQSAGRVIRTQEDTGIILLLDERFAGKDYRNLFPAEWSDRGNCTLNTVEEQLGSFWNRIREKN